MIYIFFLFIFEGLLVWHIVLSSRLLQAISIQKNINNFDNFIKQRYWYPILICKICYRYRVQTIINDVESETKFHLKNRFCILHILLYWLLVFLYYIFFYMIKNFKKYYYKSREILLWNLLRAWLIVKLFESKFSLCFVNTDPHFRCKCLFRCNTFIFDCAILCYVNVKFRLSSELDKQKWINQRSHVHFLYLAIFVFSVEDIENKNKHVHLRYGKLRVISEQDGSYNCVESISLLDIWFINGSFV